MESLLLRWKWPNDALKERSLALRKRISIHIQIFKYEIYPKCSYEMVMNKLVVNGISLWPWVRYTHTPKCLEPKTIRKVQNSRNYLQQFFSNQCANWNTHVQSEVVVLCLLSRSLSIKSIPPSKSIISNPIVTRSSHYFFVNIQWDALKVNLNV